MTMLWNLLTLLLLQGGLVDADARNLLIGVIASILAALAVGVVTGLVFPGLKWFLQRRTVDLQGKWDVFDSLVPQGRPVGSWTVRQRGNHLSIKIHRHLNRQGDPMDRRFDATGQWRNDQLTAVFHDLTGQHRTGAIVLRWRGSGTPMTLSGRTVYWDRTPDPGDVIDASGVVANPYSIRRRQD